MVTVRTHPILESRKENRLQLRAEGFELLGGVVEGRAENRLQWASVGGGRF